MPRIKAKVLYVISRTDKLFPPSIAPAVMEKLKAPGVTADYFEIDSELGHSTSRLEAFMATLPRGAQSQSSVERATPVALMP